MRENREQNCPAAVNPAVRLGSLVSEAHSLATFSCRGFFVRSTRQVLWAGRVGGREPCRPSDRSANLHGSAHPLGRGQAGFSNRFPRTTAMCTETTGAIAPTRKTSPHQFFSCNPEQDMLFAVREGLPATDALEMALCFLASAQDITEEVAQAEHDDRIWGAFYLIKMAMAVVDAAVGAVMDEERNHG